VSKIIGFWSSPLVMLHGLPSWIWSLHWGEHSDIIVDSVQGLGLNGQKTLSFASLMSVSDIKLRSPSHRATFSVGHEEKDCIIIPSPLRNQSTRLCSGGLLNRKANYSPSSSQLTSGWFIFLGLKTLSTTQWRPCAQAIQTFLLATVTQKNIHSVYRQRFACGCCSSLLQYK